MPQDIRQAFLHLWREAPALLCAFVFCLGALFALETIWAMPLFILLLFTTNSRQIPKLTLLFLLPLTYIQIPHETTKGEGRFIVDSITASRSHFKRGYCHRGRWSFDNKKLGKNLPTSVFSNEKLSSFSATGCVTKELHLKTENQKPLTNFSLLPYRLEAKKKVSQYIHKRIKQQSAATFLTALFTGEMEDKLLFNDFSNLGLTHLLAISGLHFALFTLFCRWMLFFLPKKPRTIVLLLLLTTYFLFLGSSPSIQRAYFFMVVLFFGQLINKECCSLNLLGVALLIAAIHNPFCLKTLGLQLSFLATLSILLFYKPVKEPLDELKQKPAIQQIFTCMLVPLKRSFFLMFSVQLMIVPVLLLRFHYFYPHTLIYNLFFPFLMSLSLLLLLLSFLIPPLHSINGIYTAALLKLVENPPLLLPGIFLEEVSVVWVGVILLLLFVTGVYRRCSC